MPKHRRSGFGKSALAWIGLVLIGASMIWLHLIPSGNERPDAAGPAKHLAVASVVIDAGHGGQDSGAMRDGILEKDLTLDVARRLEATLRSSGLTTVLTRGDDHALSLAARAEVANQESNCVFVSIHFDEGGRAEATGVQTYYAARPSPKMRLASWLPFLQPVSAPATNQESQSLASFVQDALVAKTQAFNRGTRAEQFYVVANVRHPAVLVEGGFLSNNNDLAKITNDAYRQQLASGIGEGVLRYCRMAGAH
jgi:N-acetylmuramoyl-L-alanine amidase